MSTDSAIKAGWRVVPDHDPKIERFVHDCHHCGETEVNIHRAAHSHMGPTNVWKYGHEDAFDCIDHLNGKIEMLVSCIKQATDRITLLELEILALKRKENKE